MKHKIDAGSIALLNKDPYCMSEKEHGHSVEAIAQLFLTRKQKASKLLS